MIPNGLMSLVIADRREITDTELQRIRENGEGNGFKVLNPDDGFRRDGRVWFGDCSVCGERVSNSWRDGVWSHTVYTSKSYHADGSLLSSTSHQTDYCPTAREREGLPN